MRLSRAEREAVCMVLDEFLAGHDAEMVRAMGFAASEDAASRVLALLVSANLKLTPPPRKRRV